MVSGFNLEDIINRFDIINKVGDKYHVGDTEGAMSLALGGSFLGSCFIQKKPFYTAQNYIPDWD